MRGKEKRARLTVLSAAEVLRVRRETMQLADADETERALRLQAALLALSLRRGQERLFADGDAALAALSLGQLRRFSAEYEQLDEGAQLEALSTSLSAQSTQSVQERNESFDEARFAQLKAGKAPVPAQQSAQEQPGQAPAAAETVHAPVTRIVQPAQTPVSVQELSWTLERDARRYDGAFTML